MERISPHSLQRFFWRYNTDVKRISAESLGAKCVRAIENACAHDESLLVTMNGLAMAQLIPLRREPRRVAPKELFDSMKGQVGITGDIVSPLFAPIEEVEALKAEVKRLRHFRNRISKIRNQK